MSATASQITSLTIVYSTVYSGADQRKHQSYASLAFVREIHRWPVNSPHKGPVARKIFQFDHVIMCLNINGNARGNSPQVNQEFNKNTRTIMTLDIDSSICSIDSKVCKFVFKNWAPGICRWHIWSSYHGSRWLGLEHVFRKLPLGANPLLGIHQW